MAGANKNFKQSRPSRQQFIGNFEGSSAVMNSLNENNYVSQSPMVQQQFNAQYQNLNGYPSNSSNPDMNFASPHLNHTFNDQMSPQTNYIQNLNTPSSGSNSLFYTPQNFVPQSTMRRSMPQNAYTMSHISPQAVQNSPLFNTVARPQNMPESELVTQDGFEDAFFGLPNSQADTTEFDLNDMMPPAVNNFQMVPRTTPQQKPVDVHNIGVQHGNGGQVYYNQDTRAQMSRNPAQTVPASRPVQGLIPMTPQLNPSDMNYPNTGHNLVMQSPQQPRAFQPSQANIPKHYLPVQQYEYGNLPTAQLMSQPPSAANKLTGNVSQTPAMRMASSPATPNSSNITTAGIRRLQQQVLERRLKAQHNASIPPNMPQMNRTRAADFLYDNNSVQPQQQPYANIPHDIMARSQQNSGGASHQYGDNNQNTHFGYPSSNQGQVGYLTEQLLGPARANSRQGFVSQSPIQRQAQNVPMQQQQPNPNRFPQMSSQQIARQITCMQPVPSPAQNFMALQQGNHAPQTSAFSTYPLQNSAINSAAGANKKGEIATIAAGTQFENQPLNQPSLAGYNWNNAFGIPKPTEAGKKRKSSGFQQDASVLGYAENPPAKRTKGAASTKPKVPKDPAKPKRRYTKRQSKYASVEKVVPNSNSLTTDQRYVAPTANQISHQIFTTDQTVGYPSGDVLGGVVESIETVDPTLLQTGPASHQTPSLMNQSHAASVTQQPAGNMAFSPSTGDFYTSAPNPTIPSYNPYLVHLGVEDTTPEGKKAILNRILAASYAHNPTDLPSSDHQPWNINTPAQLPQRSISNVLPITYQQTRPPPTDDVPATFPGQEIIDLDAGNSYSTEATITETEPEITNSQPVTTEPVAAEPTTTQSVVPEPAVVEPTPDTNTNPIEAPRDPNIAAFEAAIAEIDRQNELRDQQKRSPATTIEEPAEPSQPIFETYANGVTYEIAADFGKNDDGLDDLFNDGLDDLFNGDFDDAFRNDFADLRQQEM